MEKGLHSVSVGLLVVDDGDQVVGAERFVDVCVRSAVVPFDSLFDSVFGGQENQYHVA